MVFNIYVQVSVLRLPISGNCADVFGKNGKYTLYLDVILLIFVIPGIKLNNFLSAWEKQIFLKSYKFSDIERNLEGLRGCEIISNNWKPCFWKNVFYFILNPHFVHGVMLMLKQDFLKVLFLTQCSLIYISDLYDGLTLI